MSTVTLSGRGLGSLGFRVLDVAVCEQRSVWLGLWRAWANEEIMAHPDYVALLARPEDRVVCVAGESEGGVVLFPMLLRALAAEPWTRPGERRWDAISPYGYGGPLAWGPGPRDDAAFWRAHAAWCREERIVSTFARLSLFEGDLAALPWTPLSRGGNIVVPLSNGLEAVWRGYKKDVRRRVRGAERSGLQVVADPTGDRLDDFLTVYTHTMHRREANAEYFFARGFFEAIIAHQPGRFMFHHVLLGGEVVASELTLHSKERAYGFLGGTLEAALHLGASSFLLHAVATWAVAAGKKHYVLGGAHRRGDGLLENKRRFAPRGEHPFKVLCAVHDQDGYRELFHDREIFETRNGRSWEPRPEFFPAYRG